MNIKTIQIDKDLHGEIKIICAKQGISIKEYIEGLIKKDVEKSIN